MKILALRTDKPLAEVILLEDEAVIEKYEWEAHRQLSETLHQKITDLLEAHQLSWHDLEGLVCFKGPGSFTGIRIGVSVANALSVSLIVPIIGSSGEDWLDAGVHQLVAASKNIDKSQVSFSQLVSPDYGAPAAITPPRK